MDPAPAIVVALPTAATAAAPPTADENAHDIIMNEVFTEEEGLTTRAIIQTGEAPMPAQNGAAPIPAPAEIAPAVDNPPAPPAPEVTIQRRSRRPLADEPLAFLVEYLNSPQNVHKRPEGVRREGEDIYDDLLAYKTMQRFARTAKKNQKNKNVKLRLRT